jgi:hypothetical protein
MLTVSESSTFAIFSFFSPFADEKALGGFLTSFATSWAMPSSAPHTVNQHESKTATPLSNG